MHQNKTQHGKNEPHQSLSKGTLTALTMPDSPALESCSSSGPAPIPQVDRPPSESPELCVTHAHLSFGPDPPQSLVPFPHHLVKVDLSHNAIVILPDTFAKLSRVRHLDLSHNLLERFPNTFQSFSQLTYLNLSHNSLKKLPSGFCSLSRCVFLDVSFNGELGLSGFEDLHGSNFGRRCRKLRHLNAAHCNLTAVPEALCGLLDLAQLELGSSAAEDDLSQEGTDNSLMILPDIILNVTQLTSLRAPNVGLSDLPEAFGRLTFLKHLDLSSNRIAWLPGTFTQLHNLVHVNLSRNNLESLPYQIEGMSSLRELYVSHNGLTWITEDIGRAKGRLKVLDLYANKLDWAGIEPIKDLELLEQLDLGQNDLDRGEIDKLVKDYSTLELSLRQNLKVAHRLEVPAQIFRKDLGSETDSNADDWSDNQGGSGEDKIFCDSSEERYDSPSREEENFIAEKDSEEEEIWSVESNPTQDKSGYPWAKIVPKNEVEEESWDGRRSKSPKAGVEGKIEYDFTNMGKYICGMNKFCPSDSHPTSMAENWNKAGKSDYSFLSRPGWKYPKRHLVGKPVEGQFDDAD